MELPENLKNLPQNVQDILSRHLKPDTKITNEEPETKKMVDPLLGHPDLPRKPRGNFTTFAVESQPKEKE